MIVSFIALLFLTHVPSSVGDGQIFYQGFASAKLSLDGNAVVTPAGLLMLTNTTEMQKGHAFHPTPLHFLNKSAATATARSFSASFVFAIVPTREGLSDHGIAFVVSPTMNFSKANAGQYLGLFNATNGTASDRILAVELDTIMNPEFQDINSNHVGIDINSLISEPAQPAGYYDEAAGGALRELKLNSRRPMQVWVDYDGNARQLNVTLSPVKMSKPKRPLLSATVDLSGLADPMYVGFSSATGIESTYHYVLGWSFNLDGPAPPLDFSKLPVVPRVGPKPRSKLLDVLLPLAAALLVAAVLAAVFFFLWRKRRYAEVREDWEDDFGPHRFSYKDLFHATDGFKDRNLLGVGGFGRVYKGLLPASNLEIAVKRVSHDSRQGVKEFVAEVVSIGRLRHRNLVQLLGYCRRKGELLLVYDYMANGSLDKYLHDQHMPTLSWHTRYQIISGVAASLVYLHEDWEQVVIHRDVKASNVLLDAEMNGRLGDFGLARLYDHGTDPQTTRVVGTMGYLAPELVRTGKATPLTDVFAFGMFLLEVVCGHRPIYRDEHDRRIMLVDWVIEHHHKGSILDVVDPRIVGKYETEEVTLVLKLGLMCAHPMPNERPTMRRIMQYLDSTEQVPDLSPSYMSYGTMTLMQSEGFDSLLLKAKPSEQENGHYAFHILHSLSMMFHHLYLITLLLLVLPADRCITAVAAADGDGRPFIYNGFKGANLTLDGSATVTPNGLLMLTNGSIQMKGHAFHPSPLPFQQDGQNSSAPRSFSTTFVFAIFGPYPDRSTHGFAFFIAANRAVLSTAMTSKYLGLLNDNNDGNQSNHVFAVEFDTLFNTELFDPNGNHVGVDINSLKSHVTANAGYYDDGTGQFRNLSLVNRKAMQAWVDYDGVATQLTVTMAPLGLARPKKPLLQTTVNLSEVVQSTAYVGFSAATGILFSRHYVAGWSFALDGPAPALNIAELPNLPPAGPKPRSKVLEIVLPIASATVVFSVGIVIYTLVRRRIKYAEIHEDWEVAYGPHRFSYKDSFHATTGFSDKQLLGAGGFGSVYKGVLRKPNIQVAVKKVSHESRQGMKEFVAEVASMGRLRHRNLVPLLGYCRRKGELLLIYDYMPNGSLDKYLYDPSKSPLDWSLRFHIIRGVASGLLYLHEDWEQVVIHRDVKASNVLLDVEMNGRLGDFGLARLYDHGDDAHTTHVVGTMGYLAPELGHTGKATPATDVFAFGAFLLEVTCGRRPIEHDEHNNCVVLVDRIMEYWRKGSIINAIDPRIPDGYNPEEVSLVLKLALLCLHPLPNARPTMRQVTRYLDGDMILPDMSPAYLDFTLMDRIYGTGLNQNVVSCMSSTSVGSISELSIGR
ncbi:hypothetical protein PR202_gb21388 [Eleusine coracana subsp. coracana]|uniref:non-specific serine/threonine protein kinase n=1 Tax=Eleusine coracana subsp. coracana TaxID=191504 RepID=A0AAV5FF20_ELECO|nr:hypothetical protein PR202_gb21388 [Eleusine coracana subsp. coracana]